MISSDIILETIKLGIHQKIAYFTGEVFIIVTTVRIHGRWLLVALKEQLPCAFVSSLEEPHQSLILLWVELPQRTALVLTWKDLANQHHLDHINELDLFG